MTSNYKWQENIYIRKYIEDVENGVYETCEDLRKGIQKVKTDLEKPDVWIDHDKIQEAIDYMHKYFYKLFPWECFVVALAVGCFKSRRLLYNEFMIMIGRGNGKNGLISALSNYFQTSKHGIKNYGVDIIASSEDQAKTSFEDVYNMLHEKKNEKVRKKFYHCTKEIITFKATNSYLRFNTSNANTKDGKRTACIIADEIHSYKDASSINVFTSGLGKIPFSRTFYITTDGKVRGGVLDDFKEEAKMILNGEFPNARMLPLIYKMDNLEEVFKDGKAQFKNKHLFEKANPSMRYLEILEDQIIDDLSKSERRPQIYLETMTKRFNLPAEDTRTMVANWEEIKATNLPLPLDLEDNMCIGGLDFSSIRDFMGCILIFKRDGKYYIKHHTFICKQALEVTKFNEKLLEIFHNPEYCTIVDTKTLSADIPAKWFLEQSEKYHILKICCDNYRAAHVSKVFEENGLPLHIMRNGSFTHSKVHLILEELFANNNIIYGDDPMMRWYTGNVYVHTDGKGNKTYQKIEPIKRKTDGFMALVHALSESDELPTESFDFDIECKTY